MALSMSRLRFCVDLVNFGREDDQQKLCVVCSMCVGVCFVSFGQAPIDDRDFRVCLVSACSVTCLSVRVR
jgi:hypothetical protein